jgi:hypothetical protein
MYASNSTFSMSMCERVRWYVFSFGAETDVHSVYWDGNTAILDRRRVDVVGLVPATFRTVDMVPDTSGKFEIKCHTHANAVLGMEGYYSVRHQHLVAPSELTGYGPRERVYYIAGIQNVILNEIGCF